MNKKKIAIGLSGGVDSSVAALLLKEAGYDVFALFMQNWHDTTGTLHGDCEWEEDLSVAKMVAKKIGIPFHFVDLSGVYRQQVVDYMFDEYERGRTPNPDVLCNSKIKFDAFLKYAQELGADYVATGHYCQKAVLTDDEGFPILREADANGSRRGVKEEIGPYGECLADDPMKYIYRIISGSDNNKDQTYFLCQLNQEQLSRAMFPVGNIIKPEVRRLAAQANLPSAEKKDSQGICFVGKVDLPVFLQQKLKSKEGKVVEIFSDFYDRLEGYPGYGRGLTVTEKEHEAGRDIEFSIKESSSSKNDMKEVSDSDLKELVSEYHYKESDGKFIGKHPGAQFFTIGQRKGLNIGGHKESIFIINIDIDNNIIYVGEGHHHPGLLRKALCIANDEVHWIREDLKMKAGESRDYMLRIRYRQPLQKATLYQREDALYIVFEQHQRGICSGQFAAWYTADDLEMIGSGVIAAKF